MNFTNDNEYDQFIRETMINQPVLNIGMIGHVANGKSTITKILTGTSTQKHADEKIRNITIRLGYANAKIFKCLDCQSPECYQSTGSSITFYKCKYCNNVCDLVAHISITDVPGHNLLMSTMLNGTCVMDYSILVESAVNQTIPAPQTVEHYQITNKVAIETKLVCLNKVDLLAKSKDKILSAVNSIRNFVGNETPVIPVSGTLDCNIDVLCEYISNMKIPKKNLTSDFKMFVIRSFNVNNSNTSIADLKGGVIGGSLARGIIKNDQSVVIYPGQIIKLTEKDKSGVEWTYKPLRSKVVSINTDKTKLKYAIPGGLIGVQLTIDPAMSRDDSLVGQVVFSEDKNHDSIKIYEGIKVKYSNINDNDIIDNKPEKNIKKGSHVQVNINSNNIKGTVVKCTENNVYIELEKPICVEHGDTVSINKILENSGISICGYGTVIDGIPSKMME